MGMLKCYNVLSWASIYCLRSFNNLLLRIFRDLIEQLSLELFLSSYLRLLSHHWWKVLMKLCGNDRITWRWMQVRQRCGLIVGDLSCSVWHDYVVIVDVKCAHKLSIILWWVMLQFIVHRLSRSHSPPCDHCHLIVVTNTWYSRLGNRWVDRGKPLIWHSINNRRGWTRLFALRGTFVAVL